MPEAIRVADMQRLTPDMRAVIEAAHLCFAATVSADGRPNVSPKGTIRVWDDHTLFFLDIASPQTRANILERPWMELNVVEQLSRRGYRFSGPAAVHTGDETYAAACRHVFGDTGASYPVTAAILLSVEKASPLFSPGYLHTESEAKMREQWRARRASLDREFEAFLAGRSAAGPE
jgi:predicted pyridoxine 5'-phosphate oxidase superfamily flavin-nucleotide-binding protein